MNYCAAQHTFALCAYKKSPYLEECILSLLNQTVKSRILIATSTPCEETINLAEKYNLPLLINDAEPGIGSDWNFAYASADTPLVTIAHQDDIYESQYTEQMLQYINRAKDPIIYFCGYGELRNGMKTQSNALLKIKNGMLRPLKRTRNWDKKKVRRRILALGNPICCPSVTYIKTDLDSDVFFDISYKCDLDWDQWEKLSKKDGSFVYNPKLLMYHRIHIESETSSLIENRTRTQEDLEIFKRFWSPKTAVALNKFYSLSLKSNNLKKDS